MREREQRWSGRGGIEGGEGAEGREEVGRRDSIQVLGSQDTKDIPSGNSSL